MEDNPSPSTEAAQPIPAPDITLSPSGSKAMSISDESDFDASKMSSEDSEEEMDEVSALSSAVGRLVRPGDRQRKIFATDGRLGGQAQKRAWRTRQSKMKRRNENQ